jgi:hypothetical protein
MAARIVVRSVDRRRGVADVEVTLAPGQQAHRVGWLRGEGWFCVTCGHSRCPHIVTATEVVPDMEKP